MSNELKPFPFCGRKPIVEKWASGGLMYMIKCNNPDCAVPSNGYPAGHNIEKVIVQWNRRTEYADT